MKKQLGFISSSSSVAVVWSYSSWSFTRTRTVNSNSTFTDTVAFTDQWTTMKSNAYERIESFMTNEQILGEPYSKSTLEYLPIWNYTPPVASGQLYDGFVDLVISFPCEMRLAGIELLNPWISEALTSTSSSYWKYLPYKFNVYKVDNTRRNEAGDNYTYDADVAQFTKFDYTATVRPVRYDDIENDDALVLLGAYNFIDWKNRSSYKCFFRYNQDDMASKNAEGSSTGTATWTCKELVIRIYETLVKNDYRSLSIDGSSTTTYIKENIAKYITAKENEYGTTVAGNVVTDNDSLRLLEAQLDYANNSEDPEASLWVSSTRGITDLPAVLQQWKFQGRTKRDYSKVPNVKFNVGIQYKLGGIQLLYAPDVFSISEMKMYNYAGKENNRVFLGEWNPTTKEIEYYGAKTVKISPTLKVDEKSDVISWKHNFNLSPKYLDAQVCIRFNMEYDTFKVGDVVTNLVNVDNAPLSVKILNNYVECSLKKGIGFTNPTTGEFMSFFNNVGVQMDRPGDYTALKAALRVGAEILEAGSSVASEISGGLPFEIYFIVKRLF